MVFTRSQKRQLDQVEDILVNDEYTNVNIIKRKKIAHKQTVSTQTYSETTEPEISYSDTTKEQKIHSLKLKKSQVDSIIKESIKQLVKRFDEDEMTLTEQEQENDEYNEFLNNVEDIYNGDFFQRIPIEDRRKRLMSQYTPDQIKEFNEKLNGIRKIYKENAPSVIDILQINSDVSTQQKLLEKLYNFVNSEPLSLEYNTNLKYILQNTRNDYDKPLLDLEEKILKHSNDQASDDYKFRILNSKMSFENKVVAYKRYEVMEKYEETDSSEYAKYKNWIDTLLSIPFGNYYTFEKDLNFVRKTLDEKLSFLEKPKDQIINVVSQMLKNSDSSINAIGLWGAKGQGKTEICKSIAEALGRPFRMLSLGGESDVSMLTGHNFTYVGSIPGRIIDILKETKCMNPVILLDELDKVSEGHHGKEIIGSLIHLTDSSTNNKYNYDRYFAGVEFDLSKALFIFTYNDSTKIDKILADRLLKIKVENYTTKEKIAIAEKHLIPNLCGKFKMNIDFSTDALEYLVHTCKNGEGMREIKQKLEIIISRINTLITTKDNPDIIRLQYKKLSAYYNNYNFDKIVIKDHIDLLLNDSAFEECDNSVPFGMYT